MSALAIIHRPMSDEVELMLDILRSDGWSRNSWSVHRRAPEVALAQGLIAAGHMRCRESANSTVILSVTTAGARHLAQTGAVTIAELAVDVEKWRWNLIGYRRRIDQGLADASICDGYDHVPDEPFARVAAAILLKAGDADQRGPADEREEQYFGMDALFIRASDKAMGTA